MRRNDPAQFTRAADLEAYLNSRRAELGRDPVFFTARGKPLPMAINNGQQPELFEDDVCDSGYCFM